MIRAGAATDATALAELAARTFRETFAADNRPEDMALHTALAYGTSQQQRELIDPDIVTLLVEVDGQLAGYAQLRSGVPPACVADVGSHEFMVGTDAQTDRILVRPLPTVISNGAA